MKGITGGVDGVFICAGMLRGDSVYGPGMNTSQRSQSSWTELPTGRIPDTWGRSRNPPVRGPPSCFRNQRENTVGGVGSVLVYLAGSGRVSAWLFVP